jgi:hypothetical protein
MNRFCFGRGEGNINYQVKDLVRVFVCALKSSVASVGDTIFLKKRALPLSCSFNWWEKIRMQHL